ASSRIAPAFHPEVTMTRSLAVVLATLGLSACGGDGEHTDEPAVIDGEQSARPSPDVFADDASGAQLVFVGQDSTIRPDERNTATFVPLSTFSVERDGIPNEFPRPDSMAALLSEAGLRHRRVVIVGEPIPAGRAY